VVWAFLKGMSKRKHVPWRNIWLDK
jgi:hypothetical protein